jgi:hypothetical protein
MAAAAADKISQKQIDQGKAEAPAAIQAAKVNCTMSDAYFIQGGIDTKTKAKAALYEVACSEGPGFIIQTSGDTAQAFDCLSMAASGQGKKDAVVCKLPENADPKQGAAKLVQATGQPCPSATAARPMGATPTGDIYTEVACSNDIGYVIQTSPGKPPMASDCVQMLGGGNTECTLTSKEKILAGMTQLASKSGKPCTVSNVRVVGTDKTSGSTYYEVACGSQPGFMIQTSAKREFLSAVPCDKAQGIAGGCTMTVVDETAEAGTYTKLATQANWPCDVSRYRYLGKETKSNSELVELACKNKPEGGVGVFPISGGKPQVLDCIQAGAYGVTCQLTKTDLLYPAYTKRLADKGKTQCQVSGAKFLASTTDGSDYIETACSDGLPGFVISIDHTTGATKELLTCGQVSRSGAACSLPTNAGKK